jgi:hypothetical protein
MSSEFEGKHIFIDFHHGELYNSFIMLFEKRLGCKIYRPIGLEWFNEGFWHIADPYPDPLDTARQYLDYGANQIHDPLKREFFANNNIKIEDGVYYCWQPSQETYHKAITFDHFKKMDIDIIISSIPAHDVAYAELIRKYKPKAKHICQMGNLWGPTNVPNVMCSFPSSRAIINPGQNIVFYNQEFDLNLFKYTSPSMKKKITNFVHLFPSQDLYNKFKDKLPEFEWRSYGQGCPDHCLSPLTAIAKEMQNSMFGWHVKPRGDGYGHIFMNWFAVGRPMITNMSDYSHRSNFLIDGETYINLESRNFEDNIKKIREFSEPSIHKSMCDKVYSTFHNNINFDKDEGNIRAFLGRLK